MKLLTVVLFSLSLMVFTSCAHKHHDKTGGCKPDHSCCKDGSCSLEKKAEKKSCCDKDKKDCKDKKKCDSKKKDCKDKKKCENKKDKQA